jgi:hypothetical protein
MAGLEGEPNSPSGWRPSAFRPSSEQPLLTKIRPVPSRLVTIVLAPVSPNSVSTPEEKLAVVAMGCDPEVLIARQFLS